jgi:hypothetical protein
MDKAKIAKLEKELEEANTKIKNLTKERDDLLENKKHLRYILDNSREIIGAAIKTLSFLEAQNKENDVGAEIRSFMVTRAKKNIGL